MSQSRRASPRRLRIPAAAAAVLVAAAAIADAAPAGEAPHGGVHVISAECLVYLSVPADARDPVVEWEHALSLAACLQGEAAAEEVVISEPAQLEGLVEALQFRLDIPMRLYLEVLASAPADIQLRAAFHIGYSQVALSTRARSAIAAPPDLANNPASAASYEALHARLEPLLLRSRRAAWYSFRAITEAAERNPALDSDPVAHHMIRTARALLPGLADARPEPVLPGSLLSAIRPGG